MSFDLWYLRYRDANYLNQRRFWKIITDADQDGIMKKFGFIFVLLVLVGFSTQSYAALIDRGGGLIYDTDYNITWLQEPSNSSLTWGQAMTWAQGLKAGGVSGWRLPTSLNPDLSGPEGGFNVTGSEMGHLYYTELGNSARGPLTNIGPFMNWQYNVLYWSGTEITPSVPPHAWIFQFENGYQTVYNQSGVPGASYALAVHSGDVGAPSPVPIPGAILLFAPGLAGLGLLRRRFTK